MTAVVPLRDSRTLHGHGLLTSAEEVRARWQTHADRVAASGAGFHERPGSTELERVADACDAYVSDNRWVADCPFCGGGIACWDEMYDGCCYDCGRILEIRFPSSSELRRAEVVLCKRPPVNRHWRPGVETVDDLKAENAVRGFDFTETP